MNIGTYQKPARSSSIFVSHRPSDFGRLARAALGASSSNVWLLRGPLGSGKTTFARAVLRALGHRRAVRSPTFGLVHHYRTTDERWRSAVHVDAYRIVSAHEVAALDLPTVIADERCLVLIEWPERLKIRHWGAAARFVFSHRGRSRVVRWSIAT